MVNPMTEFMNQEEARVKRRQSALNKAGIAFGMTTGVVGGLGSNILSSTGIDYIKGSNILNKNKVKWNRLAKGTGYYSAAAGASVVGITGLAYAIKKGMESNNRKNIKRLSEKDKEIISTVVASKLL